MSLTPFCLRLLEDLTPNNIYDQDFGLGLLNDDLVLPRSMIPYLRRPDMAIYRRPRVQGSGTSNMVSNKDEFKINLDVQQFKPEEISVKVVNNSVVIDGKHEERQDEHGYITREFKRRYVLPEDVDPATVTSSLSSDGVLSVSAPKKLAIAAGNARTVPITHTNQPAITAENKDAKKEAPQKMEQ